MKFEGLFKMLNSSLVLSKFFLNFSEKMKALILFILVKKERKKKNIYIYIYWNNRSIFKRRILDVFWLSPVVLLD